MHPHYSAQTLRGFIVFEGLDGAGTTTQAQALVDGLKHSGRPALLTSEPTSGPIGSTIKLALRGRLATAPTREQVDRQLAYLFAADRFDHLYNGTDGIERQIAKGFTVVSTRYYFSSYAYNARTAADFDLVDRLNRDFPLPELVVYLRVPMEVSLDRLAKRDLREHYEREDELERVAGNFSRLFEPIHDRVLDFRSDGNKEELSAKILRAVQERLGKG